MSGNNSAIRFRNSGYLLLGISKTKAMKRGGKPYFNNDSTKTRTAFT